MLHWRRFMCRRLFERLPMNSSKQIPYYFFIYTVCNSLIVAFFICFFYIYLGFRCDSHRRRIRFSYSERSLGIRFKWYLKRQKRAVCHLLNLNNFQNYLEFATSFTCFTRISVFPRNDKHQTLKASWIRRMN